MTLGDPTNEIRTIISTLAGTRKSSRDEKMMRLLQLKRWLIEEEKDDLTILSRAASAYAGMRITSIISQQMRELKANLAGATPSCAVRSLVDEENEAFMQLLDRGFKLGSGFAALQPFRSDDVGWAERVESVCHYVGLCVRLVSQDRQNIKGTAYKLYDLAAMAQTRTLRKDIKPLTSKRRSRLAFVYVARRLDDWLLLQPDHSGPLTALLKAQTKDVALIQKYFARCAYVQSILARGDDVSGKLIARWAGTDPIMPGTVKAISQSEISAAEKLFDDKQGK